MSASAREMTAVSYRGTGPGHERPARRPVRHDVRPDDRHHQPDQERQDQGLCRDHARRASRFCRICRRSTSRASRASRCRPGTPCGRRRACPPTVVEKLTTALQAALKDAKVIERFAEPRHRAREARPGDAGGAQGAADVGGRQVGPGDQGGGREGQLTVRHCFPGCEQWPRAQRSRSLPAICFVGEAELDCLPSRRSQPPRSPRASFLPACSSAPSRCPTASSSRPCASIPPMTALPPTGTCSI